LKILIFFLSDLAYDVTETATLNLYYFWTALTFMLLLSFAFFSLMHCRSKTCLYSIVP